MKLKIALLPGDGIGPEVLAQAVKCLQAVEETFYHQFTFETAAVGAAAIAQSGKPLPTRTLDLCGQSDAVLFGAIGTPQYDNDPLAAVRPEQGLLELRKQLGLFANIRPVKVFPELLERSPVKASTIEGANFTIYRELTGGIYFGEKQTNTEGTEASDLCHYSEKEIGRIAHLAFKEAKKRRKKLTLVDKANVLETSRLWRKVVTRIGQSYPEVELEYLFVDHAAMQLILNPKRFDVILTENLFGDILSDEGSVIGGSIGLLPSASIGEKFALFEPVHGSFPEAQGLDIANPIAAILSAALLLKHFGLEEEALAVEAAVDKALKQNVVTPDLNPDTQYGTQTVGDFIAESIMEAEEILNMNNENIGLGKSTII